MSKDLTGITRNDLEQLLQDHTDRVVQSVEQVRTELKGDMAAFREEVNMRFDRLETRTDEDAKAAFKEIERLKLALAKVVAHVEKVTGTKVEI